MRSRRRGSSRSSGRTPKPPFPEQAAIYDYIRNAPVRKNEVEGKTAGDVEAAFKTAARVIEAEYEWPFQSHASMGPACALVEIKDGQVTLLDRHAEAAFRARRRRRHSRHAGDNVHAIWMPGPGSYGRNDAGDAAMDAARARQSRRQAGARAIYARPGHRLGSERPGLDPSRRAPRSTPPATSLPMNS